MNNVYVESQAVMNKPDREFSLVLRENGRVRPLNADEVEEFIKVSKQAFCVNLGEEHSVNLLY